MTRSFALLLVGGFLALVPAATASAAPSAPGPSPLRSAGDESGVVKVHGYHRACRWGPGRGWWHRHVGPYGRPVPCGRYRHYRYYYGPHWHGPGITLRFGHRHRFHRHHHHRWR